MGWKGRGWQNGYGFWMDINYLEIRSLFTELSLGITLVCWIRQSGSNSYLEKTRSGRRLDSTIEEKHEGKKNKTQGVFLELHSAVLRVLLKVSILEDTPPPQKWFWWGAGTECHGVSWLDFIHFSRSDPKQFLIVTCIKHDLFRESHWNSKPPSSGPITTDRCLTYILDAAHSESLFLSPHAPHLPAPSLRPHPLPNVHMRFALCPYGSLALFLSLVQRGHSLHLTLPPFSTHLQLRFVENTPILLPKLATISRLHRLRRW